MAVRHFSDAAAIADHILTVEPTNASGIGIKAFALWSMGDLEAADALAANSHADVEVRGYHAMIKRRYAEAADILEKGLNDKPDQEKAGLFLGLGLAQRRAGNGAAARTAYQQAAQEFQRELGIAAPDSGPAAQLHSALGLAYAGLGDSASAVAEGQKGMVMQPSSEDPFEGPGREEAMAQIYALLGDADHAIPILKRLLQTSAPTEIVPTLLRLDPIWDSIRDDPRFEELVAEKKP
jgi:serine/threonine-protein kinase